MTITVPANIGADPIKIIINGVTYTVGAGATVTVPDAVGAEILRRAAAMDKPAPGVELPFEDAALKAAVAALETRMAAVEAAVAVKELPEFPESDGTYGLQLVMDDGAGTLTWEAAEAETTPDATET